MCLDAAQFPISLARTLVAIALGTEDRLINVTLAALAELCILNPELFISVGGVTAILRSLSSVRSARMAEALVGSLLYLLNKPATRLRTGLSLDCLAAPYTDLQAADKTKENQGSDRLKWPHVTLLSTLRSWPGVLHFCHPLKDGLRSIVATLYLNQLDVRKAVLDLLYELLCLAQPEWSDEMSVALEAVDPSRSQEDFKLSEGFIAAEGKAVLPHLSKCRVNLSELHLSLLLYCFLEVGLLDAIVEVIIAEDTFLSVRATILLGELLHLIHLLLPPECCHLTPSLPNLLSYAVRGRPHSATRFGYGFSDTPDSVSTAQSASGSYTGIDVTNKKDNLSMRGVRSGHSSVRTVSESSTDKVPKQDMPASNMSDAPDRRIGNEDDSPYGSEKKDLTEASKQKIGGDHTAHLLKDVREVLADMTSAANIKSPHKSSRSRRRGQSESDTFSFGSSEVSQTEPPHCSRAQQRALAAVTALSRLHRLLRQRPAPASIHLDHVLASVTGRPGLDGLELARAKGKTQSRNKLTQALTKECDEAIKDSQVLTNKDCFAWNWDIIRAVLKSRPECLRKCEESSHRQFLRRLVQFVLPTSRQMSRVDFSTDRRTVNTYTLTAMELLDCLLLGQEDSECEKLLMELLTGLKTQFEAISTAKSAHDCMFNPQTICNTLCQDYFLLAGHLSRSKLGCDALDKMGIIKVFLVLATESKHDCYVKLIISSLDYTSDKRTRNVLSSTLVCKQVSSRLYATKFLRVLLRTPLTKRGDCAQWVIELLANQLSDENRAVSLSAIAALDEACDCKEYLEALINLRPSLLHLGDKGLLLLIRFLSTEKGFGYMSEANFVSTQLAKWVTFNYKYVCIVEGELTDGLTLVERNEDGRYSSRLSHNKCVPGDVFVPAHLYGQLVRHQPGLNALLASDNIPKLVQVVHQGQCNTDSEILDLKAALWALGHLSSTPGGALWARANSVTRAFVSLASTSPVYSIRSTAFHAIALTSSNTEGADTLRALGWHTVRHNRNQHWPVVTPLTLLEDALIQYQEDRYMHRDSSESTTTDSVHKNGLFILGEDSSVDGNDLFPGLTARERAVRERKAATLPPGGSTHTYHHNRSYSESKADTDWGRSVTPAPSHSGSDIADFRSHENCRLYSESSTSGTSSCGDSSQPRTYLSERLMQTLSPIPSTGSLTTAKTSRRVSVASFQSPQLSPQDMVGYAALRNLHRSRRPTFFATPHLSLHFSQSAPVTLSPLSPIELIAFQDWKQMSPLVRPKHPGHNFIEPQFEVTGIMCPLPGDAHTPRTLHYESSRACIAQPPEDSVEDSAGPCYIGICLPQHLMDLFPEEEFAVKAEDPGQDNTSTTGMDVSSCDSETDTAPEVEADLNKPLAPLKRRHDRTTCLLCSASKLANPRQTRWRKISASSQHRVRTETESSYGGAGNDGESPVMLPWQSRGLEGITSVDSSSTDITSVAQKSVGDSFKSRSMVRKEILRLADQLCNPILYKTCKQTLLQIKQIYGDVFNDVCVYSDVCAIMASASHRIYARRFLQELFLDAPFSELYEDPLGILTVPNNAESEDGLCVNKLSLGSEAAVTEELTAETNSWKSSGAKMNGFDSEQRSGQGYELEVILESDARSESSDVCRGSGEGGRGRSSTAGSRGSITPLEPKVFQEVLNEVSSRVEQTSDGGWIVHSPVLQTVMSEDECHITVSKSSQQLRKEFFNATLSEPKTSLEKEIHVPFESKTGEKCNESFVTKVADSISKSQGMLETKLQSPTAKDETVLLSSPVTVSQLLNMGNFQKNVSQEPKVMKKNITVPETSNKKNEQSSMPSVKKPDKNGSRTSIQDAINNGSTPLNNVVKSPQLAKKGKKLNNTKHSSSRSEASSTKPSEEQLSATLNVEQLNQSKDSISPKVKTEAKQDSLACNKAQKTTTAEAGSDASSSKGVLKGNKKLGESPNAAKPPSGSGRQRKKATTKTPNRNSFDSTKKRSDSESR